ncbi:hypothetical protein FACS1894206_05280 [Deltaproteobacteria bacterium]|nr:hypothetical protein FACS1894206_05280 [Deltaproteobacteria bacterium]
MRYVVKELLFVIGAIVLALLFFVESRMLTDSAAMFPRMMASAIIVLAAVMGIQAVRKSRIKVEDTREPVQVKRICIFLGILVCYMALVEPLGYFIATPLYIVAAYLYLRAVSPAAAIAIAVGFALLIYGIFVQILHLPVPMGLLAS